MCGCARAHTHHHHHTTPNTLPLTHCLTTQVLRLLVRLYEHSPAPDVVDICQCLMFLDDAPEVAAILDRLLRSSQVRAMRAMRRPSLPGCLRFRVQDVLSCVCVCVCACVSASA